MDPARIVSLLLEDDEKSELLAHPDPDHTPCGQKCGICGEAKCTLVHRQSDRATRHLCQPCDIHQFNSLLDRL